MIITNKIYNEDCIITMTRIPDEFVDLTITSPPYDNLRTYKGITWNEDIWKIIINDLFRITKQGGVVVWVVGDATINGSETGTSFKQALYFINCGFNLHDTMIYEKNGSSFPSRRDGNRYTQIFEYMFIFSKGKPTKASLICDKKNRWIGCIPGKSEVKDKNGKVKKIKWKPVPSFSPRNNIWRYSTGANYSTKDKIAFEHPAIFPDKLVHDHILSWSNEDDLIYDPFMDSGTTAKMAKQLSRHFIGSELSKEYCGIAKQRLAQEYLF